MSKLFKISLKNSIGKFFFQVNVGSGVSILRVDSKETFQRVGGTSVGGRFAFK